jgi:NhaP-type Na+/H+ or K+/H+ antiporter
VYALMNVALFIGCGLVLSGSTPIDQHANEGALQRRLAITVFGAIGVVATVALSASTRTDRFVG